VLALTGSFINSIIGLAGFVSNVIYDAVSGLVVISRVLGHKIVVGSGSLVLLVVLAAAVFVLSRLISDYHHRTGATE
jgi:hypothetical protein